MTLEICQLLSNFGIQYTYKHTPLALALALGSRLVSGVLPSSRAGLHSGTYLLSTVITEHCQGKMHNEIKSYLQVGSKLDCSVPTSGSCYAIYGITPSVFCSYCYGILWNS